jgi:hypothetical protein
MNDRNRDPLLSERRAVAQHPPFATFFTSPFV